MSFGWSIGDVLLLAQYSWKVYESFADGSLNATNEYDRFKREYRQIITCLERLADVSPDLASLAGFDETFGDTIKFIDKHRLLTAKSTRPLITLLPQTSSRLRDFLDQFGRGYQTATWPIYREEAEKLHGQLDRVVAIATLHATTTTLKNTQGIERQSEDIMRAVKSLSDKVNFVLKRIAPTSFTSTSDIDLEYLTTLSHTTISQLDSSRQVVASLNRRESPEDMLRLLHQFSQKMEYLIMRDSRGVRPTARSQTTNSQGPVTTEQIVPVLQLLDSARTVADTALGLPRTQSRAQERSASASLEARVDDWDVFSQWLKWHMLHNVSPEMIQSDRTTRPTINASMNESPPTSPGALEAPHQHLTGQYRDISPSIVGSLLPEPVWTPGTEAFSTPGTIFTSASSQRRFSSIDLGSAYTEEVTHLASTTWPVSILLENKRTFDALLEILVSPDGTVEKLRSKTRDQKFTLYHVPSGGSNRANAFIPWIDNSRVHKASINEARLQFKGSHQVIVKDEKTHRSTIYNTRPVYRFNETEDLLNVQEQLLGKSVVATFDVVRVSTRASQDHCASETLRILEDVERQRSLLYYAHKMPSKSATTNPGFIEWSLNDFEEIKKEGRKKIRLTFSRRDSLPRRSTIGSIDSVLSHDSTSSEDPQTNIKHRIKAIDCEFYDQEDREAFEELCKPSSAPIFRMPFRPRDLGIGSPMTELSLGPPLAELEG
ncbi:hypothetical protein QM012_003612 [Aureobasidium pullulans]|uniref:Fungal N-terminal domain-containing protein n=1 Tax=Aureobasidium pullulans TaxID=5580 RepID=A0ABR0T8U8_AURPU